MKPVVKIDEKAEKSISDAVHGDIEKAKKKDAVVEKDKKPRKSIFGVPLETIGVRSRQQRAKKG